MEHRLDLVHLAIVSGVMGHVQWKGSAEALVREDPAMDELHPKAIRQALRDFVMAGGQLEPRAETRQEYLDENPDHPFWYRARLDIPGMSRHLFVEVKIVDFDEANPWVEIVSAHF